MSNRTTEANDQLKQLKQLKQLEQLVETYVEYYCKAHCEIVTKSTYRLGSYTLIPSLIWKICNSCLLQRHENLL